VHEVESIRENLILDLNTAASYERSGHRGTLDLRMPFLRWRMALGLAKALWPGSSHRRRLAHIPSTARVPPAPVSDRLVPCRTAASGSDARAGNSVAASTGGEPAGISVDRPTSALPLRP